MQKSKRIFVAAKFRRSARRADKCIMHQTLRPAQPIFRPPAHLRLRKKRGSPGPCVLLLSLWKLSGPACRGMYCCYAGGSAPNPPRHLSLCANGMANRLGPLLTFTGRCAYPCEAAAKDRAIPQHSQGGFRPQNRPRRDALFLVCGVGSTRRFRWSRVQWMKCDDVTLGHSGRARELCAWKI
jgi:hypothetical protein